MRVPLSWLREFVAVDAPIDDLVARFGSLGLPVEELVRTGEGIERVVVGRVLEVRDHPTSNKPLVLVKADVGEAEPLDIVCGARNFGAGDLVPVAVPGAKLPGGMEIVKRKLAGETSNGMLCSARELGVSDDHSGILVLWEGLTLGEDVRVALGLDDVIFDLDVTPNRPDCLSVLGIARELAAAYGLPVHDPDPQLSESGPPVESLASVSIEDTEGCPRYVARVVSGIGPAETPWWMRRRLLACGMRPISPVVDVTNYVMLERGQPMHAFDLRTLTDSRVVVRRGRDGETLTTLDGIDRALTSDDVVIADPARAIAIGGVMGGEATEVGESTTDILLESAWFEPVRVLRTARRVGLRTEASVRFERGADTQGARRAADRACALLAEITGGTVAPGAIEAGPGPREPNRIALSIARSDALIGIRSTAEEIAGILERIGCVVEPGARDAFAVHPPTWRPDLRIEEDLIEEIARLVGYDEVPVTLPAGGRRGGLTAAQMLRRTARRAMLGAGLSEAQTLSLIPPGFADRVSLPASHPWRDVLRLANPLSEDESVLRPSLLPGLLLAAQRNVARRQISVALFEIGVTFAPSGAELPNETLELAWVMTGPRPEGWHRAAEPFDFYDASGVLASVCDAIGVRDVELRAATPGAPYHASRSAEVLVGGAAAGVVAELSPSVAEALDLPGRVAVGAVRIDALTDAAEAARAMPLPRFPAVTRDLALLVPDTEAAADVASAIAKAAGPLLESIAPFDVYRGEQVEAGKVSIAFSLSFRDPERTLTDDEVDAAMGRATAAATERGWTVRE